METLLLILLDWFGGAIVSLILGMILNIVMFLPFGSFLPIYFKHFRKMQITVLAGFLMSLSIEIMQLFTLRATDIDDLIMNTIGALAGYGISKIILGKNHNYEREDKDQMKLFFMILVIGLVIVFVRYPLMELLYEFLNL